MRVLFKGIGKPVYVLGADMKMVEDPEKVFTMGLYTYVKRILKQFDTLMDYEPPPRVNTPMGQNNHLERDDSKFVTSKARKKYWSLMGMLQWAVII